MYNCLRQSTEDAWTFVGRQLVPSSIACSYTDESTPHIFIGLAQSHAVSHPREHAGPYWASLISDGEEINVGVNQEYDCTIYVLVLTTFHPRGRKGCPLRGPETKNPLCHDTLGGLKDRAETHPSKKPHAQPAPLHQSSPLFHPRGWKRASPEGAGCE